MKVVIYTSMYLKPVQVDVVLGVRLYSDRNDSTYAHAQSEPRGFDACLCSSAVI